MSFAPADPSSSCLMLLLSFLSWLVLLSQTIYFSWSSLLFRSLFPILRQMHSITNLRVWQSTWKTGYGARVRDPGHLHPQVAVVFWQALYEEWAIENVWESRGNAFKKCKYFTECRRAERRNWDTFGFASEISGYFSFRRKHKMYSKWQTFSTYAFKAPPLFCPFSVSTVIAHNSLPSVPKVNR